MSNKYEGVEKHNEILNYIRSKKLELPHLMDLYKLWNAAKLEKVCFLRTPESQQWFGHALFTIDVKAYEANRLTERIQCLFKPDQTRAIVMLPAMGSTYTPPSPVPATYAMPPDPGVLTYTLDEQEVQLERYATLSALFANLEGALDVLALMIACIYDLEGLEQSYLRCHKIRLLKLDFGKVMNLLYNLDQEHAPEVSNLNALFGTESLLVPSGRQTSSIWYEELHAQRNYYVHIGFPTLYYMNGEWFIPEDPRTGALPTPLPLSVPGKCKKLTDGVRRFLGAVLRCVWNDFSPKLR